MYRDMLRSRKSTLHLYRIEYYHRVRVIIAIGIRIQRDGALTVDLEYDHPGALGHYRLLRLEHDTKAVISVAKKFHLSRPGVGIGRSRHQDMIHVSVALMRNLPGCRDSRRCGEH